MKIALSREQSPIAFRVHEELTVNRENLANRIIRDHVTFAMAAGAIPVPLVDIAAVTVVQVDAVRALARVYEIEFDPAVGKGLIVSIIGASAGRCAASIAKAVPGVGWVPATIANAAFAGASTYAVSHLFWVHFAREGKLEDLDPASVRPLYEELFERGRSFVRNIRWPATRSVEDTTGLLERLSRLREQGAVDQDEFERLKREIFAAAT
jgi:uncharacterized protein (DUF697 family)